MKRVALALIESGLTLALAIVLGVLLVGAGTVAWGLVVDGDPLARAAGAVPAIERHDYEIPLVRLRDDATDLESLVGDVAGVGAADAVSVEGEADARVLVVENVPAGELSAILRVLGRNGYQSRTFAKRGGFTLPGPLGPSVGPGVIVMAISIQALVFGGLGFFMAWLRIRPDDRGRRWSVPASVGVGVGVGAAAVAGTVVISAVLALLGFEIREQDWVVALARENPAALWLLAPWTVVIGPVAEEVFFRGYLFRFLGYRVSWGLGYAVSAVAFAVIHFHAPAIPLYLFYGLLLAAAYRLTSRLTAAVVGHMAINLVSTVVLFLTAGELAV